MKKLVILGIFLLVGVMGCKNPPAVGTSSPAVNASNSISDYSYLPNPIADNGIPPTYLGKEYYNRTAITLNNTEYTLYYLALSKKREFNWGDKDKTEDEVIYSLKDSATKNSNFEVWVTIKNEKLDHVTPLGFYTKSHDSFLQSIILNNTRKQGEKIFTEIIRQIEANGSESAYTYSGIGINQEIREIIVKTEVYVKEVYPDTPASKANLKPGDQILKINGKKVEGVLDLASIKELPPGSKVALIILRNGKKIIIHTHTEMITLKLSGSK